MPGPLDVLTAVTWIVLPAVVLVAGHRRLRAAGSRAVGWGTVATGGAGLVVAGVALLPSVSVAAERVFAAHMAQHLALGLAAPLLVVIGRVPEVVPWALPTPTRLATRHHLGFLARPPRSVVAPTVAMVVVWYAWHVPVLYGAAVDVPIVHVVEHLSLVGAGCWFWAAVAPHRRRTGGVVLASFSLVLALGFLGAVLSLSPVAFYGSHVAAATTVAQLDDQHLGGLLMWTPGGLVYLVTAVIQLVRWLEIDSGRPEPRLTPQGGVSP